MSIGVKEEIIMQAIDGIFHVQFDLERGIIVEQLDTSSQNTTGMMNNSGLMDASLQSAEVRKRVALSEEARRQRIRNRREIESLENQVNKGDGGKRMCGCEAFCAIF